jgi:signal transduction histidine kinase
MNTIFDGMLSVIMWLSIVGNLYLGLLVYTKSRKTVTYISLGLFAFFSALWAVGLYFFQHPQIVSSDSWLRFVYVNVVIVCSFLYLFSLVFPLSRIQQYKTRFIFCVVTGLPFIYFIVATKTFLVGVVHESWGYSQTLGPLYPIFGAWCFVSCIGALVNLLRSFKVVSLIEKLQLRFIFVGLTFFVIIPLTLDVIFPVLFHNSKYIWFSATSSIFFVGSVAYIILKHRFLDLRAVTVRLLGYLIASVLIIVLYVVVILFLLSYFSPGPVPLSRLIPGTILTVVIAILFQPMQRFFQKATVRIFYQEYYTLDDFLSSVSQVLATKLELNAVMCGVLEVMHKYFHSTSSTIIVYDKEYDYVIESSSILSLHMSIVKEDLDVLKEGNKLLVYEEMEDSKQKEVMRKHDIGLFMPFATQHATIGYLLLGDKASGDVYFSQDIKALQIIAPELAIALENSQSYQKIKIFNETLKVEVASATKDLRTANMHLKQLDKLKDEFISIASHELRTPLTTLKGFLELELKDTDKLTYDSRNHLERAYTSSERMIALVNDMLDVSRIESGRMTFSLTSCDLGAGVNEVVAEEEAHIKEKHATVEVIGGANISVFVDCVRMNQVLLNLVDNALKFIPDGGHITITCKDTEKEGSFAVSDNGPGIRKEDFPRLFTKFGRLGTSYTSMSETKGTGLGLYICKKLVELQHGKISVKSEIGKGSTFTVTVPKVAPEGGLPDIKKSGTLKMEEHG